jgi:hypothetical protein
MASNGFGFSVAVDGISLFHVASSLNQNFAWYNLACHASISLFLLGRSALLYFAVSCPIAV